MRTSGLRGVTVVLALAAIAPFFDQGTASAQGVRQYDVVWDSPSADAHGSMPLGNGDISLNAWVEPTGDLCFYIGKTDAWGEHGRLLKVGKLRVTLDPPLPTEPFQQRLELESGRMLLDAGAGEEAVEMRLWVDANRPTVRVEVVSRRPRTATAVIEPWRTEREAIPRADVSDTFEDRSKPNNLRREVFVDPDVLLEGIGEAVGWYHFAQARSDYAELVVIQGLQAAYDGEPDPLLHRVFGAMVTTERGERIDAAKLRSPSSLRHRFGVHVHSAHPSSPEDWLAAARDLAAEDAAVEWRAGLTGHTRWWRDFWRRSWIEVSSATDEPRRIVPDNRLPARIGIDQHGQNRFVGEIGRVTVLPRAVEPTQPKVWAVSDRDGVAACAVEPLYAGVGGIGEAIEGSPPWSFDRGLGIEAWVRPGALPPGGGRIVDKTTPGGSDGWLLDTYPGNSLRFIVGRIIVRADGVLPEGQWSHVAASVDPENGRIVLYLDGNPVATETLDTADDAFVVSRAYALQRYIDACAGRGRYPIKFNGSIFTVPDEASWGDADYRRWGPGYWWQNTRLPYLSMCASGDFEMLWPLFRMYVEELSAVHLHRTRRYTGHGGLFIPECIYFWGGSFAATYGWTPLVDRGEDKLQESPWHKREWVSSLELAWMMLDYYEHTQEEAFLRDRLVPFATEVLRFFDEQFAPDSQGRLVMEPTQALETWWDTTNPMPEVAGLRALTARLLALPAASASQEDRAYWTAVAAKLPALPTTEVDGVEMLAPAARFENKSNVENPELYAVFPFRLVSFEKDNAPLGIAALDHRRDRGASGWRQDDLFMTHLGLAEQARTNLVARARNKHAGSRFPAFWGPNYDWVPDQDHGGVLMRTLQTMLMQTDGRTIYLQPAWPDGWNADFKLHAPYQTTITGRVRDGRVLGLEVEPPARRADIIIVREP